MLNINLKVDIERAKAKFAHLPAEIREKATVRAINDTAAQAKIQASREIRDAGYGMKVGDIKKAISLRKANASLLKATVTAKGRPIPLIKFNARQVKAGVSISVKNGRKLIKGAFIITKQDGTQGVFVRHGNEHRPITTRAGKRVWSAYQIHELYGPSIPIAFSNQKVQEALEKAVREKFPQNFKREVRYLSLKH
jgi:hypothetical protein